MRAVTEGLRAVAGPLPLSPPWHPYAVTNSISSGGYQPDPLQLPLTAIDTATATCRHWKEAATGTTWFRL